MTVTIAPEVAALFPDARIGVLEATGVRNGADDDAVGAVLDDACRAAHARLEATPVADQPFVAAWREAYRTFGVSPNRYRPSAEALLRRVARDASLPRINAVVDLYNAASVRAMLPFGGYDVGRLRGPVRLTRSPGGEEFVPLGGDDPEPTVEGEVVYRDDESVLTRHWNHRDCERTKITPATTDVVLLCEAPNADVPTEAVTDALEWLAERLETACGARVATSVDDAAPG